MKSIDRYLYGGGHRLSNGMYNGFPEVNTPMKYTVRYMIAGRIEVEAKSEDDAASKFNQMTPDTDMRYFGDYDAILEGLNPDGVQIISVEDNDE